MTQSEVSQELRWLGLGDWNKATDVYKDFEAYGDGRIKSVQVLPDGEMIASGYVAGESMILYKGYPADSDQIADIVLGLGHYAPC